MNLIGERHEDDVLERLAGLRVVVGRVEAGETGAVGIHPVAGRIEHVDVVVGLDLAEDERLVPLKRQLVQAVGADARGDGAVAEVMHRLRPDVGRDLVELDVRAARGGKRLGGIEGNRLIGRLVRLDPIVAGG